MAVSDIDASGSMCVLAYARTLTLPSKANRMGRRLGQCGNPLFERGGISDGIEKKGFLD
jgi:hypothetical protein